MNFLTQIGLFFCVPYLLIKLTWYVLHTGALLLSYCICQGLIVVGIIISWLGGPGDGESAPRGEGDIEQGVRQNSEPTNQHTRVVRLPRRKSKCPITTEATGWISPELARMTEERN